MKTIVLLALVFLAALPGGVSSHSQDSPTEQAATDARFDSLQSEIDALDRRVGRLSSDLDDAADTGLVLFLFGAFCALWARNSGRSAWSWFFLGLLFSVVAVAVLLSKNAADQRAAEQAGLRSA